MPDRREYNKDYGRRYRERNIEAIKENSWAYRRKMQAALAGRTAEEKRLAEIAAGCDHEWRLKRTPEARKKTLRETHHAAIDSIISSLKARGELKRKE